MLFFFGGLGLLHVLFLFLGKTGLEVFVTKLSSPEFKVRFESCIRSAVGFPEVIKCFPLFILPRVEQTFGVWLARVWQSKTR